ncbi:hypothetical protein [Paracoccus seriniphilus]|uniref:Uncharacterized protein n=1 Tax=Paracoccus seriniphilus TaxID=184748 RepID=A0A239Q1Q1_9RHOB|nr:hypothetical protein [Paracoccus seriniphilus]WCR16286.1 hypothetical protein JHW44_19680 [Paracoccus seriniphilus]SNT75887.1 hypothetical protein SAMN05444959_11385 [Paracoccus seriniphilus]
MKYFDHMTDTTLCAHILQGLDILHDQIQRNDADMPATDLILVLQSLSALRRNGPLSETAADEIGRIESLLDQAISQETLGFRNVFDGIEDPELGAVGRVRAVPVLSEKGAALDRLLKGFRQFLAMRNLLAARVDSRLMVNRKIAA